jgi:hypothetical protein
MLANLLIRTAGRQVMVIPAAAVVRENNRDHVYVQSAQNIFTLTPVDLGPPADGELRPVIKGLDAGQMIVVSGAFHLNNERRKQELPMIAALVRSALNQRLVVVICALVLFAFGLQAARKLAVDAFPDVTNVQVQIATDAPGVRPRRSSDSSPYRSRSV